MTGLDAEQPRVIATAVDLVAQAPDLAGALVLGLDLRAVPLDWPALDLREAAFAGCDVGPDAAAAIDRAGAAVLAPIDGLGFEPYRAGLYTNDELMAGYRSGDPTTTLDARIGASTLASSSALEVLSRGIHDACIDAALDRFVSARGDSVVAVMGSHETGRDDPGYREVATLGRTLTRRGWTVATGGGPGLMEAANLGAWLAPAPEGALEDALDVLARAPHYEDDPAGYLERALEVRAGQDAGATSLGVPTWVYVDEPLNQFATAIAKYFQNSIRENGLLAVALGGVIFTPGGSGTAQEAFTDAAQNDYSLYGVRSPMVFLGRAAFEQADGLAPPLRALARRGGWDELVRVVDDVDAAVDAIEELAPSVEAPAVRAHRRR